MGKNPPAKRLLYDADYRAEALRFGLVVVPQVGGQEIEVGGVAKLTLVVDDENELGAEADDIDQASIEQLV